MATETISMPPSQEPFRHSPGAGVTRLHHMPFGAEVQPQGGVRFRVCAPGSDGMSVSLEGRGEPLPMAAVGEGWYELVTSAAAAGTRYQFLLADGTRVADPVSRYQPEGVTGPSEVVDPAAYRWCDGGWPGRIWHEAIIYELHIGTFTREGTFLAAIEKLDHLRDLGVTCIEVMPIGQFAGERGWGYDGVLLYAPQHSYGRPEDFKRLIEEAHERGIMVLLDVVYNHFGPEGNLLPKYYPKLFTEAHKTSWGSAVNYDGEGSGFVRELVIQNALYWVEEFHVDGLRLDAVHAIMDEGKKHVLRELAERVRGLELEHPVHLVLENENREVFWLEREDDGWPKLYSAQWNDDMHHVLHTAATHESEGYYKDYCGFTDLLARSLAVGFAFENSSSTIDALNVGEAARALPPRAFISFIQNHDQIGNRAYGERINHIAKPEAVRALAATYLLLPQTPMLFMGEEWCSLRPFPYFADYHGELADKIREGRRKEFEKFPEFQDPEKRDRIPDPIASKTFESAKLDWDAIEGGSHDGCLCHYRSLLKTRREQLMPLLDRVHGRSAEWKVFGPGAVQVRWKMGDGGELRLYANLCDRPKDTFPGHTEGRVIWHEGAEIEGKLFAPWTVLWTLLDPA